MNKQEFVFYVAEKNDITKTAAKEYVDMVFDTLGEVLVNGENVKIVGFGNFEQRERSARTGRNPQTGESMPIPASKNVGLKLSDKLKGQLQI